MVDVFVDELDLAVLGFDIAPVGTGRPAHHPALNRAQSSRRLEREALRNLS